MKNRKALYYLPLIYVDRSIELSNFKIKPYSKELDCNSLLPTDIFDGKGSLLEVEGFLSGSDFCSEIDVKIFNVLENIKFSYFFLNPSAVQDHRGFVASETFECFTILERSKDSSFEHKVNITNGMYTFSQSMKLYYEFRKSIGLTIVEMKSSDFIYSDLFASMINDSSQFSAMKLYNRCWGTYSIHSHFDKALLARTSIEALLPSLSFSKKGYVDSFWNYAIAHIESNTETSSVVNKIYNCLKPKLEKIKVNFENHINNLRQARDNLVHDGKDDPEYINIPFYLIWFPLFWMVSQNTPVISEKESLRLVLFFGLLGFDVKKWQHIDLNGLKCTRTHLDTYIFTSRVLPVYLENQRSDTVNATIDGLSNWLSKIKS